MSRPEEAILEAMQTMQLLNGGLVDRMAAIGPLGLEQPVKRDQLGRIHCPKYLATFRDIGGNVTAKKLYT